MAELTMPLRQVVWSNRKLVVALDSRGLLDSVYQPQIGVVTITPQAKEVRYVGSSPAQTLENDPTQANLVAGVMSVSLPPTDHPDIRPNNGWVYTFKGTWANSPTITTPLLTVAVDPNTGQMPPLDLGAILSVIDPPTSATITQGETGRGIVSVVSNGLLATVTYTDQTTSTFNLPAAGKASAFVFTQKTAAATWTIAHNLGRDPAGVFLVVGGSLVDTDVDLPDINTAVLTFAQPTSGRVTII